MVQAERKIHSELLQRNLLILDKASKILQHSYEVCSKIGVHKDYDISQLDAFEALTARFARSADLFTQKILPSVFTFLQETPKTFIDRVNLAEKLGLVDDVNNLRDIRELRNMIAHEYTLDEVADCFRDVLVCTDILLKIISIFFDRVDKLIKPLS